MCRWGSLVRFVLALVLLLTLAWFTAMSCQVPSAVGMSGSEVHSRALPELKLPQVTMSKATAAAPTAPPPCMAGGWAGNCTHSNQCSASHFCHPEERSCQPFCQLQKRDASDMAMRNCSKCMEGCEGSAKKCLGFIEERPGSQRLGGCAKQVLLDVCPMCKESCRDLSNETPIRFPRDEPSDRDVWITSYPKTGSTWVRHLITNLHAASQDNMSIANFKTVDEFIPFIEDGKGWTNMSMFRQRTGFRIWKSHQPFHCDTFPCKGGVVHRQGASQCLCPNCAGKFQRVIYIYRNGYSTLASYFRFRLGLGQIRGGRNFESFINDRRMYPGVSWADHFRSWQHAAASSTVKIYWLRYEDLQASPERELQRLAAFLHLNVTKEHIRFAINASSAKTMQEMEQREGGVNFFKIRYNKPKLKFVTGGSGELSTEKLWSQVPEEALAVWQLHNGPVMRCLGYLELPPQ